MTAEFKGKIMLAFRCGLLPSILLTVAPFVSAAERVGDFPLQDGDLWIMAGDSITAQQLHSNYFEAFCFARYPHLTFAFRNGGVGGATIPSTLARFDYDIAAWKPTVVSVELGMNDKDSASADKYLENMKGMIDRIRSIQARPVILAPSPVNNGETLAKLGRGNERLHEFAAGLTGFCRRENVAYADQFHALLDLWGKNKPRELLAESLAALRQAAGDDSLAGVEHLRMFLAAQEQTADRPVSMQGNIIHPGPPGQLMMAAALLRELGAEGFVSNVTIEATGQLVDAKGCQVDRVSVRDGILRFDRLDERLPFPIPEEARAVLPMYPTILELSQYTLEVTGLKAERYTLKINGVTTATLSAKDFEAGLNLTTLGSGQQTGSANPIFAQGRAILGSVAAKERLVDQWRALSQKSHTEGASAESMRQLAALTTKVQQADAKTREAARPRKLRFELIPAK